MKPHIQILGDGSFGTFLKEFLSSRFHINQCRERDHEWNNRLEICPIILAMPIHALKEVATHYSHRYVINVCSTQKNSNDILREINANNFTAIHPLFGKRTPENMRHAIITEKSKRFAEYEEEFLYNFGSLASSITTMTDVEHDIIMAKTHVAAVLAAKQMEVFVERAKDIPDNCLPNSFRLLKNFVKTLEDTPKGTLDTILSNQYC